jgi:heme exporter protein CcmD
MMAETHTFFIAWSYAGAGLLTLGLIAWVAWDALRVKKRLADLEKAGVRRRSAGAPAR